MKRLWFFATWVVAVIALVSLSATSSLAWQQEDEIHFKLKRAVGLVSSGCLPDAGGKVSIESEGPVEDMTVRVFGLPPNTDFDFFVIQIPHAPFGLAWYQADIETNEQGRGSGRFIGRFNIETFIVSQGSVDSPIVFNNAFPDVCPGPTTGPIHTYHLGLWFNDPNDAANAGCPNTVTPFNGEHDAGIQALNTSDFPDLQGPLIQLGQ